MPVTAHECSPGLTTRWPGRPSLEAVRHDGEAALRARDVVEAHALQGESRVGRGAMLGAAVGFAVATIVITVAGTLSGIEPASAFGLGVFVGIWGGAGFGFMMGATLTLVRHTDDAAHPNPATTRTRGD